MFVCVNSLEEWRDLIKEEWGKDIGVWVAAGPLGNIFSRRNIPRESGVTNELFYSSISVQFFRISWYLVVCSCVPLSSIQKCWCDRVYINYCLCAHANCLHHLSVVSIQSYIPTYIIHTYLHTYLHTYTHTVIHTYYIHTVIHTYIHTYIHTCIHTYTHIHAYYIHTYTHTYVRHTHTHT